MKFDDIKARWQGYSTRKKWIIAGIGAVLCIAVVNGDHKDGGRGRDIGGDTADLSGHAPTGSAPGYGYQTAPGYAGGYAVSGYGGGGAAPTGGSADIMSGWQHNQNVQERAAHAFDQNIRGESTIRSTETGEVYSGVSNPTADSAVESGAATQVPTAELPTTTTTEPEQ